jgi:hypothetical protein
MGQDGAYFTERADGESVGSTRAHQPQLANCWLVGKGSALLRHVAHEDIVRGFENEQIR